ncbi:peptide-methionine (R)-S-oxide reductase [candidate division WWE3 bacterium CG22_combo_CG10-13_8_21_14_all_39_12]|uniref:peptide-methionine (R)-S-oxide reductase n=2 Tax=Katanobacteria TaxID=422282 RepID=A0A2M7X090_UNCKA|nr:MAG: peptide-methionine (R)-S-oxide reductase [candidate division WWE3 bacterium CG22_combo_CG10-13_8_21_14_all_39_12]PJA39425.1 MAG: peptide-methionine (R)-S-oxide reductase [candidate division WWE3 bacterium CG_4_9_14_3_um_filter_39_7]
MNTLTAEEKAVIIDKKIEKPFTGKYDDHWDNGIYVCRQCETPLYTSNSKFRAHCGWPSFDQEIRSAINRTPDPLFNRTEITCLRCGAHLGHVFEGEQLTETNVRHCVNSISLKFIPAEE